MWQKVDDWLQTKDAPGPRRWAGSFIALFFLIGFTVIAQNTITMGLLLVGIVALTVWNPHVPLVAWVMLLPYENLYRNAGVISPFYGTLFLSIFSIYALLRKRPLQTWNLAVALFAGVLLVLSTLAALNGADVLPLARNVLSLGTILLVFYGLTLLVQHEALGYWHIASGIFTTIAISSVESLARSEGWRYTVGGNVRSFANILGIGVIIALTTLIDKFIQNNEEGLGQFKDGKMLFLMFSTPLMLVMLLITFSRGVILAVGVAVSVYLLLIVLTNLNRRVLRRVLVFVGVAVLLAVVFVNTEFFVDIGGERLFRRFSVGFASNIRFRFWGYALGKMTASQWIFGVGLSNFRAFIADGGYNFYAHSIFMDTLVSTGLLGFLLLCAFLGRSAILLVRNRNLIGIAILVFTLFSFGTHGGLFSKFFWFNLALIYALGEIQVFRPYPDRVAESRL